jgi:hypothetical protein
METRRPNKRIPKQDQSNFEKHEEKTDSEINPNKLDREELKTDEEGSNNSKGHEPYELSRDSHLLGQGGYGT